MGNTALIPRRKETRGELYDCFGFLPRGNFQMVLQGEETQIEPCGIAQWCQTQIRVWGSHGGYYLQGNVPERKELYGEKSLGVYIGVPLSHANGMVNLHETAQN